MLMYFGSKRLNPFPDTSLGSEQFSGGSGDGDDGMIDGDTFRLLGSADDIFGELFLRVALLPALRLQAGESQ